MDNTNRSITRSIMAFLLMVILTAVSMNLGYEMKTKAVVDDQIHNGELVIFDGENFIRETDVVDFVEDCKVLHQKNAPRRKIVGVYTVISGGKLVDKAVLKNGKIVELDTKLGLIPRNGNDPFDLPGSREEYRATMAYDADKASYTMTIARKGGLQDVIIEDVTDAWIAYDTIYWLVGDTAYAFNWYDVNAEPHPYFEGAIGISHFSDEAEGAIVPLEEANYAAYGRYDIFSPYGEGFAD